MLNIRLSGLMTDGNAIDAAYIQNNVVLTSSDETIAKINGSAIETLQPGVVTITATLDGKVASVELTIT